MDERGETRKREKWVDDVKVIACILVVLGHFFQSMVKSGILQGNDGYQWFETTIYFFHVPLFFICSGYLYQRYSRVNSAASWGRNAVKKAMTLGIPYVVFSTATWLLKTLFSSSVNDQAGGGLLDTLVVNPVAPYWYLYVLFFIFLVTPTFSSVKMAAVETSIALAAKCLILIQGEYSIYAVSAVLKNEIWFVLGMNIVVFDVKIKEHKRLGMAGGLLFMALSVAVYRTDIHSEAVSFAMGLLACIAVILLIAGFEEKIGGKMDFLAKYTMPIYLMHTLFAAPVRVVLLKAGIVNAGLHVAIGLASSFVGPILAAETSHWLLRRITSYCHFLVF